MLFYCEWQELRPVAGDSSDDKSESLPTLFGSVIRDSYQEDEQAEILHLASQSSCELGFEKVGIIIIIIIINDNVYGSVLMTMVTARVHPVHLMNAD